MSNIENQNHKEHVFYYLAGDRVHVSSLFSSEYIRFYHTIDGAHWEPSLGHWTFPIIEQDKVGMFFKEKDIIFSEPIRNDFIKYECIVVGNKKWYINQHNRGSSYFEKVENEKPSVFYWYLPDEKVYHVSIPYNYNTIQCFKMIDGAKWVAELNHWSFPEEQMKDVHKLLIKNHIISRPLFDHKIIENKIINFEYVNRNGYTWKIDKKFRGETKILKDGKLLMDQYDINNYPFNEIL